MPQNHGKPLCGPSTRRNPSRKAVFWVNLGDDADTTGAVYGQIARAYYGECGIPHDWWEKLARRSLIESLAGRLLELSLIF